MNIQRGCESKWKNGLVETPTKNETMVAAMKMEFAPMQAYCAVVLVPWKASKDIVMGLIVICRDFDNENESMKS